MFSVLLVGPEVAGLPALAVTTELLRIGDLRDVDLEPLIGPEVTLARFVERLDRRTWDVVIWSGHGEAAELLLSDGTRVSPLMLANQLRNNGTRLAVLAACSSAVRPAQGRLSLGFQDVLPARGVSVVAMAQEVGDLAAVAYNVALVQALEAGASIRQGHEVGLEAATAAGDGATPQLFAAGGDGEMATYNNDNWRGQQDQQLLRTMSDKIDKVSGEVSDTKTRLAVMEADMRRLVQDVQTLQSALDDLRKGTFGVPRGYLAVVVVAALLMLATMVVVMWRVL